VYHHSVVVCFSLCVIVGQTEKLSTQLFSDSHDARSRYLDALSIAHLVTNKSSFRTFIAKTSTWKTAGIAKAITDELDAASMKYVDKSFMV
jgi:hypothetical protein